MSDQGATTVVQTDVAPAAADVAGSAGGVSPLPGGSPAEPATSAAPAAWSLDSWDGTWGEALPEKVRKAAEKHYEGHVAPDEATKLRAQITTAEANLREARAASLRGSPMARRELEEARQQLEALKAEQAEYAAKWGEETFKSYQKQIEAKWEEQRAAANEAYNKAYNEAIDRQINALFPWARKPTDDAPNPAFDATKYAAAEQVAKMMDEVGLHDDIPEAVAYRLAERIAGPDAIPRLRMWATAFAATGDIHAAFQALDPTPTRGPSASGVHARATVTTPRPNANAQMGSLQKRLTEATQRALGTANPR